MFGEDISLLQGLVITVVAMGIVFIVLLVLSASIDLMRLGLHRPDNGEQSNPESGPTTVIVTESCTVNDEPCSSSANERRPELIAVISAVLAAVTGKPTTDLVVRSVKRVPQKAPVWNMVSRQEQIHTRLTCR